MSVRHKVPLTGDGSWKKMLRARPVRNEAAGTRRDDDGLLRVAVAARRPWFLVPPLSWLIRSRFKRTYGLDHLGTEVWELCDGVRSVEEIVDAFAAEHRLTFHEARASVTGYVKELVRRGALVVAV